MCDTRNCPKINLNNVCTFSDNREDEQFTLTYAGDTTKLYPFFNIPNSFNSSTNADPSVCASIGKDEWVNVNAIIPGIGDYVNQTNCPGYGTTTGYSSEQTNANPKITKCTSTKTGLNFFCSPKGGYQGNPIPCCLQNMFCQIDTQASKSQNIRDQNRYNPLCFDTNQVSQNSGICDPTYRRLGGPDCYNTLFSWCTTDTAEGTVGQKWIEGINVKGYQATAPCARLFFSTFYSNAYPTDNGLADSLIGQECYPNYQDYLTDVTVPPPQNLTGPRKAQALLDAALNTYITSGKKLTGPISGNTNSAFNLFIYELCKKYPGVCVNSLQKYCLSATINDIQRDPSLIKLCGCNLSQSVYSLYVDTFQINVECTPYCNIPGVVPVPTSFTDRGGKSCTQSLCVIDNVSLNFVDSQVGSEGVTIGNFCNSCGVNSACDCILSNITFTSINSVIPNLNLSQQCGTGSCVIPDPQPDGTIQRVKVPCNQDIAGVKVNLSTLKKAGEYVLSGLIIIFVFLILFGIFFAFWKIFGIRTDPGKPPRIEIEPDKLHTGLISNKFIDSFYS